MSFKSVDSLEENSEELFIKVTSILMKLIENVLKYPTEPKYRKIRLENATISKYVLPSVGGMECLFDMGFIEGDDSLILPNTINIDKLKQFLHAIIVIRDKVLKKDAKDDKSVASCSTPAVLQSSAPNQNQNSKNQAGHQVSTPQHSKSNELPSVTHSQAFLREMEIKSDNVCDYEDVDLQLKALSYLPLEKLESNILKKVREIQKSALKNGYTDMCEASINEIIYLKELMKWFKTEFFQWVDAPLCSSCKSNTEFQGYDFKSKDRVEVYFCKKCTKEELFPRYNNVKLLLESRRGRCGEWGQCFTLFCRALKWDARFVSDHTDHVWTEVYSKIQKRWLHCDPCECVIDKPLLYEKGWNKKLHYILAFSCDGVYDVSWRYSADHKSLVSRRNIVSEVMLMEQMLKLTHKRREHLSKNRLKYLNERHVKELVDFLLPAKDDPDELLQGRTSGSLTWRLARGEISSLETSSSYIWKPSTKEILNKKMVLKYSSVKDEYLNGCGDKLLSNWNKGVFKLKNIHRKEELDWKMVYLCRTEGSSTGSISWKFDFTSSGLVVDSINLNLSVTTFKSGLVKLLLCGADKCILVNQGNDGFKTNELKGESVILLKAELSGGEGDVSWQHAQLFRNPMLPVPDSTSDSYPFNINFTFKSK